MHGTRRRVAPVVIALTVSEILTFQTCDPKNVGQGHEVQHSQFRHSIGTQKSVQVMLCIFAPAQTLSDIIKVFNTCRDVIRWQTDVKSDSFAPPRSHRFRDEILTF